MPTLIYGTLRSHLQEVCLDQVIDLTEQQPHKRALLIVPEQTKMDVEQAYLAKSAAPGLMMAEVLSFRRLAWRILGEVGRQPLNPVDQVGRAMLIHRVLYQQQKNLYTFGHLADKPGFVTQVATVLGDLKRYRIDREQLLRAAEQATDKALQEKSRDLACVLAGYDEALSMAGLTDAEDDLTRLADVLAVLSDLPSDWPWPWSRLNWLRRSLVWVSGFGETRDFTPQEDAVLTGLVALTEQVTVTVAADAVPADQATCDLGPDAYHAGRRTAWRLCRLLPGLRLQPVTADLNDCSARIRSLLRTGAATIGAKDRQLSERQACRLQMVQAGSLDDELAWVAGEIRRLVQLEGYRYRDIRVAACNLPAVTLRLRAVCREYGIPLFLDMARPLSGTPLMRLVLGLLDIGLTNWTRTALMAYLRSGLISLSPDVVDRLENEWLARGLFRKDRIFADELYHDRSLRTVHTDLDETAGGDNETAESERDDLRVPDSDGTSLLIWRDQALHPVQEVLADLQQAATVQQKVDRLQVFFNTQDIPGRIEARVEALTAEGEMDVAVTLVQSWNALQHILDQLVRLSPDLPASLRLFRDTLAAGMDVATSGVIPSAIDQVNVGDLPRSMLRRPRIQFLVGATAANLPPDPLPEGLLKDPDRQVLSRLTGRQLPSSARDQVFSDAYVLETLLTQPTDRLYLTAAEPVPARVFRLLAASWPDCMRVLPERPGLTDARLNAPVPAFRWLLQQTARQTEQAAASTACGRLEQKLAAAGFWRPECSARVTRISPSLMTSVYEAPVVLSVSQLEQYAACPFSHLAGRLLALRRRAEWQPELAETGLLLHGILEQALSDVRRDLITHPQVEQPDFLAAFWRSCRQTDWDARIENWLTTAADQHRLNRLFDAGLNASVARRIRRMAASSLSAIFGQLEKDPFLPADFEWFFGPETGNALLLAGDDIRPVLLRGIIDRVDRRADQTTSQNGRFRIVDYKSGHRTVDYDALYHGLALQLPIYLAAYAQAYPDTEPEDAAWFTVNRPILTVKDRRKIQAELLAEQVLQMQKPTSLRMEPEDLRLLCKHALKRAAQLAEKLQAGQFPVYPCRLPGKRPPCAWCDYLAFCRFQANHDPWHRPVKPVPDQSAGEKTTARQAFLALLQKENRGDA